MNKRWRYGIPALCVALILAGYTAWNAWKAKSDARKFTVYVQECRTKAAQGNPEFEAALGGLYGNGRGVPRDDAAALMWYRKAANQGFAGGEAGVAWYYHFGIEVPRSDAEALHWYQLAANQGDPNAEDALGLIYFYGEGVPKDDAAAVRWFRKASDNGYPPAQLDLAWMYRYGRGVQRDRSAANRLLREAADHGYPEAQRIVTPGLTPVMGFFYLTVLLWDLWMLSEFCYKIPKLEHETSQKRRSAVLLANFEALSVLLTGLTWYGYTHHKILRLGYGVNAFTACKWFLFLLVAATFIPAVRSIRKRTESDSPEPSTHFPLDAHDEPEAIHPS